MNIKAVVILFFISITVLSLLSCFKYQTTPQGKLMLIHITGLPEAFTRSESGNLYYDGKCFDLFKAANLRSYFFHLNGKYISLENNQGKISLFQRGEHGFHRISVISKEIFKSHYNHYISDEEMISIGKDFKMLNEFYAKDNHQIYIKTYYATGPLPNEYYREPLFVAFPEVDIATFSWFADDLRYAKDKNAVYYFGDDALLHDPKIRGAKPDDFVPLSGHLPFSGDIYPSAHEKTVRIAITGIARDKDSLYWGTTRIEGIIPDHTFKLIYRNIFIQRSEVFQIVEKWSPNGIKIKKYENKDASSLHSLDAYYAKDRQRVYYYANELYALEKCDVETFVPLAKTYARDKYHCYWGGDIIANADPDTFEALFYPDYPDEIFAKDKTHVYRYNKMIYEGPLQNFSIHDYMRQHYKHIEKERKREKKLFEEGKIEY